MATCCKDTYVWYEHKRSCGFVVEGFVSWFVPGPAFRFIVINSLRIGCPLFLWVFICLWDVCFNFTMYFLGGSENKAENKADMQ